MLNKVERGITYVVHYIVVLFIILSRLSYSIRTQVFLCYEQHTDRKIAICDRYFKHLIVKLVE